MPDIYRFDSFELDARTGELRRDGVRLPLQPQPAAILSLLAERAGDLVTREEIQRAIWPDRTVDYEQGLNYAIRRIRSVLGDDADTPRFVETLPRRGYRLVAPVARVSRSAPAAPPRRPWILAGAIAAVLLMVVAAATVGRNRNPADPMPADPEAREAYLVAERLVETRDREQLARARQEFARVLEFDPDFVPALLGLGEAYLRSGEPAQARAPLARALDLGGGDARGHRLLAQLFLFHEWDRDAARHHLGEALRLDPRHAAVHQVHAYWLAWNREVAGAEAAMQVALQLDPLSSYVQADAGWIAYWAGRLDAAAARCTRTLELDPGNESGRLCLLFVRVAQADETSARRTARALIARKGGTPAELAAFDRDTAGGLATYWSWEIRRLEGIPRRSAHDAFLLALAYAQTGRGDEAFRELETARAGRTSWMLWLEIEPRLAPLRNDPRWPELVRRIGRPPLTAD